MMLEGNNTEEVVSAMNASLGTPIQEVVSKEKKNVLGKVTFSTKRRRETVF